MDGKLLASLTLLMDSDENSKKAKPKPSLKNYQMKVWSGPTGKVVGFNNFDDLISKVREKFNLGEERVKLALADACEVDDDDGLFAIPNMTDLYLYK